jgi:hypothetical protein
MRSALCEDEGDLLVSEIIVIIIIIICGHYSPAWILASVL